MDKLAQAFVPPSRIDLAREADFALGALRVRPSRREVEGAGVRQVLQRRVMQVLVALAQSSNDVVSQQELILRCWGGLSVSDDAISRCIAQLRRLAAIWPEPQFEIVTIAGVGYRLEPSAGGGIPPASEVARSRRGLAAILSGPWPLVALWAALPAIALAIAVFWPARERAPWATPNPSRMAVLPFDAAGPGAQTFADELLDKIVSVLSDNQIQTVSGAEGQALQGAKADHEIKRLGVGLLLDGTVQIDGKAIDVRLHLDDALEHVTLWSDEFRGPAQNSSALQTAVAVQAADVAYWAKVGRSGKVKLNASALADFIAGRESTTGVRSGNPAAALTDYQRVVAAAPDFSWGHSSVAVSDAFMLLDQQAAPDDGLRADVRREAARALALDSHNGEAYLALELAAPRLDWLTREGLLLKANAADPGFEPGALMEGRLQWFVGRGDSALPWLWRAHDIDPLHNGTSWTLAVVLAAEGDAVKSRALLARMQTEWPGHEATRLAQFWIPVVLGDDHEARALLADPATRPSELDQSAANAWRTALAAIDSGKAPARREAAMLVKAASEEGSLDHGHALLLLTMLGDLDGAFEQARLYVPSDPFEPPYFFLPQTARLRADPRFMPLARKLGYVDYWTSTGHWPDFCFAPGLPYDCKVAAARAAAERSS